MFDLSRPVLDYTGDPVFQMEDTGKKNEVKQPVLTKRLIPVGELIALHVARADLGKDNASRLFVLANRLASCGKRVEIAASDVALIAKAIAASGLVADIKMSAMYLFDPASVEDKEAREILDRMYAGNGKHDKKGK